MSEFDKHWDYWVIASNCIEDEAKIHFKAGQQSQQAKIDEFKKLRSLDEMAINQLAQANQVWQIKCDELQERIDKAMKYVSESPLKDVSRRAMINFMDILKGNKDGN